jgi:hypothetical protein
MSDVEQWVEQFMNFGAQPSPSRYVALFDPEGTVFDSGMERPLKPAAESRDSWVLRLLALGHSGSPPRAVGLGR